MVVVTRGDETLLRRAYGVADLDTREPLRVDDALPIGSITKQFTAAAVLSLVERGSLRLDAPLGDFIAGLPAQVARVTVGQLLSHTSGIADYVTDPEVASAMAKPADIADVIRREAAKPLRFEPGSDWAYSNTNYATLGLVVERATGRPFAEVLASELVGRAGLTDTTLGPRSSASSRVRGYEGRAPAPLVDTTWSYSAGGIWATADDLARWGDALSSGRVVSPDSFAAMSRPTALASGRMAPYGLGLRIERLGRHPVVWHDGAVPGFYAVLISVPEQHLVVALVSNGGAHRPDVEAAARRIAALYADSYQS